MERIHLLAAEIFRYSYANYQDHLGVNDRFDTSMPKDAKMLETAIKEDWPVEKVAKKLEISNEIANNVLQATFEALEIVDAENPAESFRKSVEHSIRYALETGIKSDEDVMKLVDQISYRAADLAHVLDMEDSKLSHYSEELRDPPRYDEMTEEFEA